MSKTPLTDMLDEMFDASDYNGLVEIIDEQKWDSLYKLELIKKLSKALAWNMFNLETQIHLIERKGMK